MSLLAIFSGFADSQADADSVVVFSHSAEIKASDGSVIARPAMGDKLVSLREKHSYFQVEWRQNDRAKRGWIHHAHLLPVRLGEAQRRQVLNALEAWSAAGKDEPSDNRRSKRETRAQALQSLMGVLGKDHMLVAAWSHDLAVLCATTGDHASAERLYRQCLESEKQALGGRHLACAVTMSNLAKLHKATGNFALAEPLFRDCLEIRRQALGGEHPEFLAALNSLGSLYSDMADYARAESHLTQCLEIQKRVLGEDHKDYADTLNNLAIVCWNIGAAERAEAHFTECLRIRKQTLGEDHPHYAAVLNNLAVLHEEQGNFASAEAMLLESLEIKKRVQGESHPDYAASLTNLAILYHSVGDCARAEPLHRQCLEIIRQALGEQHPDYALALHNLASLLDDMADYAPAEALYRQCLEIRRQTLGERHPLYASSLNNLGVVYNAIGDRARAEACFRQGMEIRKQILGEEHLDFALSLDNLGLLAQDAGELERAEAFLQQSLEIKRIALGEHHRDYAAGLNNLALLYKQAGDYGRAEPLMRQSVEIKLAALGDRHPDYAGGLNNLATIYHRLGEHDQSEPLFRQSLEIRRDVLGEMHPYYCDSLGSMGILLAERRDWTGASQMFQACRQSLQRQANRVLPGLSDRQQSAYLGRRHAQELGKALTLCIASSNDAEVARLAAEWALNGKGIAHEIRARGAVLARHTPDPDSAGLIAQLRSVEQRLSSLAMRGADTAQSADRLAQLDRLAAEQVELSKLLGQRIGRDLELPDWIELADVRARLPQNHILVEIVRFPFLDYAGDEFGDDRYGVWLIPPTAESEVRFVDLGPAAPIDAAIAAARRALQESAATMREQGEAMATAQAVEQLARLAALAFAPWQAQLGESRTIVLCPDSNLWLAPWTALPLDGGRLLIEEYTLRFVSTGRDLLREPSDVSPAQALAVADPDYGLSARELASRIGNSKQSLSDAELNRSSTGLGAAAFSRLPGTRAEAQSISPSLAAWSGQPPRVLLGADALETAVKQAHSPGVLLLSTHGFFLPEQDEQAELGDALGTSNQRAAAITTDGAPLENPLLRCGLAFAGANMRNERTNNATDDGILTGLEIVGMDLRGTELVVLSACETGLGDVRNGEGVAGLRQAFQLAGAEAVVATLWQIPDKDTAIIMGDFFANLAAGQTKAEALRNAQLKRIADRRERNGAAHPLFWAAFTLTGAME